VPSGHFASFVSSPLSEVLFFLKKEEEEEEEEEEG